MKEARGNIWTWRERRYQQVYICVTTNASVRKDGQAVMGRGIAKQAAQKYPLLPKRLAESLKVNGNHVVKLGRFGERELVSFPVKHRWMEQADLKLIERSCIELATLARHEKSSFFALPRPGCGNGGLDWDEVKQVCRMYFDYLPNIVIVDYMGGDVSLSEKSVPQELIDRRWEGSPSGVMHCKVHDTYFALQEEPCWQCYNEVQKALEEIDA